MAEFLRFRLDGEELTFRSLRQLGKWWEKERATWDWLLSKNWDEFSQLQRRTRALDAKITSGADVSAIEEELKSIFYGLRPSLPYSGSFDGQRYLSARDLVGDDAARYLVIVERHSDFQRNLQNATWFYNYARSVAASYVGFDREALAAERRNYRRAIDRLEQRVRDLEAEQDEFVRSRTHRIMALKRRLLQRSFAIWNAAAKDFAAQRSEIVDQLAETEDKYRNQMALMAPVQYWRDKATSHGKWEIAWAVLMFIYFVAAGFGIFFLAKWAAAYLLSVPESQHATPVYIIVSGATLGITTLIFWIGRLLSKLFLSEHHLGSDAREKAVMTKTFLSMETRESFSSEERAIILASIFRSSPDGIVKDEGPGDFSAPALLARFLSPQKS